MYPRALLKVTKLHDDAKLPRRATAHSIGADVYAYIKSEGGRELTWSIPAGMTRMIPTGLVCVAQPPFSILVASRSGLAAQRTLFVTNAPGIIDPDYRGEVKILLHNGGTETQFVKHQDRIAQLILVPIPLPFVEESQLDLRSLESERGDRGFGSTGE